MEESSTTDPIEKSEDVSDEIVLPKLIKVAMRVYEENWVSFKILLLNAGEDT